METTSTLDDDDDDEYAFELAEEAEKDDMISDKWNIIYMLINRIVLILIGNQYSSELPQVVLRNIRHFLR
jgi:hypothetical protein